jgi:uncharacterized SAM-dependent methyltransferase
MESCPVVVCPPIDAIDATRQPPPVSWGSRLLYVGEQGAQNWLDVVNEPGYPLRNPELFDLRNRRLEAVRGMRVGTFVSLGPGDGLHDVDLVSALLAEDKQVSVVQYGTKPMMYIPVDLSRAILEVAIQNLQSHIDIPVALLCDFEDGQSFLAEMLVKYAQPPILFSLLGGTIGNLDGDDPSFLSGMKQLMQRGDMFLLDIPLAGPAWIPADDPRLRPEGYTMAFRRFLATGIARFQTADSGELEKQAEEVVEAFSERIELQHEHDLQTGSEVIRVIDRPSGRVALTLRRYRWEAMLRWLETLGFHVQFAKCSIASEQDKFGMGVVLLTNG